MLFSRGTALILHMKISFLPCLRKHFWGLGVTSSSLNGPDGVIRIEPGNLINWRCGLQKMWVLIRNSLRKDVVDLHGEMRNLLLLELDLGTKVLILQLPLLTF